MTKHLLHSNRLFSDARRVIPTIEDRCIYHKSSLAFMRKPETLTEPADPVEKAYHLKNAIQQPTASCIPVKLRKIIYENDELTEEEERMLDDYLKSESEVDFPE